MHSVRHDVSPDWPRASAAALRLLGELAAKWHPPGAPSRLTPDGQPLELAFATQLRDLSFTAEPGPAAASPAAKRRVMHELTGFDPRADPLVAALAGRDDQSFGCWLGVRGRPGSLELKLYQEVPAGAGEDVLDHLREVEPALAGIPGLLPRLVGLRLPPTGIREYYCRVLDSRPATLHRVFAAAGVEQRLPAVIAHLAQLAGEPVAAVPNGRIRLGISFSPGCLTLFAQCGQLFASNHQARARLVELGRELGDAMAAYARATSSFEPASPAARTHGMVGISVRGDRQLDLSVGISPVRWSAPAA